MATIQLSNPYPLVLLCVMPGNNDLERELHRRLDEHKVHGEWFYPSKEVMDIVSKLPVMNYRATKSSPLEQNPRWRGIEAHLTSKRARFQRRFTIQKCAHCDNTARDRRCLDGNYENFNPSNVLMLCRKCSMVFDGRMDQFLAQSRLPKPKLPPKMCCHCKSLWKPLRNGLCRNCYEYKRRNSTDRPLMLIELFALRKAS